MKVFVTGATGVLGRRVVVELVAAGFAVTGVARSADKRAHLASINVRPIALDLFDRAAVHAAIAGHDAVLNLATAIPVGARAELASAWQDNDRIRREASRNLVDAALTTGVHRYVQESIAFLYADGGDRFLDESAPLAVATTTSAALLAEAQAKRFATHGGVGVALRFGQFYGYDSGHTIDAMSAVQAGRPAELGPESAYRSPITTDDAASAVVAALNAPSGIYNVVDDQPLTRADYVDALAHALGVPIPTVRSIDVELPPTSSMMLRSQRVLNHRFKAVTGWKPRCANARDGWDFVVAEWRAHLAAAG